MTLSRSRSIRPGTGRVRTDGQPALRVIAVRKVAATTRTDSKYRRVMIYDPMNGEGVFLFLFRSPHDAPCDVDHWYEDVDTAERDAADGFGVQPTDWQPIPDPPCGCRHDRIAEGQRASK